MLHLYTIVALLLTTLLRTVDTASYGNAVKLYEYLNWSPGIPDDVSCTSYSPSHVLRLADDAWTAYYGQSCKGYLQLTGDCEKNAFVRQQCDGKNTCTVSSNPFSLGSNLNFVLGFQCFPPNQIMNICDQSVFDIDPLYSSFLFIATPQYPKLTSASYPYNCSCSITRSVVGLAAESIIYAKLTLGSSLTYVCSTYGTSKLKQTFYNSQYLNDGMVVNLTTFGQTDCNQVVISYVAKSGRSTGDVAAFHMQLPEGSQITSVTCSNNVSPCTSNPCIHGLCQDNVGTSFTCMCFTGYIGALCDRVVYGCTPTKLLAAVTAIKPVTTDPCASNPCMNGGACYNVSFAYVCMCGKVTQWGSIQPTSGVQCEIIGARAAPPDPIQIYFYWADSDLLISTMKCGKNFIYVPPDVFTPDCTQGYVEMTGICDKNKLVLETCDGRTSCVLPPSPYGLFQLSYYCWPKDQFINMCDYPLMSFGTNVPYSEVVYLTTPGYPLLTDRSRNYTCQCKITKSNQTDSLDVLVYGTLNIGSYSQMTSECLGDSSTTMTVSTVQLSSTTNYTSQLLRTSCAVSLLTYTACAGSGDGDVFAFKFKAVGGFQNIRCSGDGFDPYPCYSNPCLNRATCLNSRGNFRCLCAPFFTGILCDIVMDACSSSPCGSGGACTINQRGYMCTCLHDYTGANCGQLINTTEQCTTGLCLNNGTCYGIAGGYSCLCTSQYVGLNCENIATGAVYPTLSFFPSPTSSWTSQAPFTIACSNNGPNYFIRIPNDVFVGSCNNGYYTLQTGCESNVFVRSQCEARSFCTLPVNPFSSQTQLYYYCWPGNNRLDMCSSQQLYLDQRQNKQLFITTPSYPSLTSRFNSYTCECKIKRYDSSGSMDALVYGKLNPGANVSVTYKCLSGFQVSSTTVTYNSSSISQMTEYTARQLNIGCTQVSISYTVSTGGYLGDAFAFFLNTQSGFVDARCSRQGYDPFPCISSPCYNGGTCLQARGSYKCVCKPGFIGTNCSAADPNYVVKIEPCASNPCVNGNCTQWPNKTYSCTCRDGFAGVQCEMAIYRKCLTMDWYSIHYKDLKWPSATIIQNMTELPCKALCITSLGINCKAALVKAIVPGVNTVPLCKILPVDRWTSGILFADDLYWNYYEYIPGCTLNKPGIVSSPTNYAVTCTPQSTGWTSILRCPPGVMFTNPYNVSTAMNSYQILCNPNSELWNTTGIPPVIYCDRKVTYKDACLPFQSKSDIVIILDSSGSIRAANIAGQPDNYQRILDFIVSIVTQLPIGENDNRIAMIIFSSQVLVAFHLNTYYSASDIVQQVSKAVYLDEATNTAGALSTMIDDVFQERNGDRPDVQNIAFVITDGQSTQNHDQTIPTAHRAQKLGIRIITIGVTNLIDVIEVQSISSPPHLLNQTYWLTTNFAVLNDIVTEVFQAFISCEIDECASNPCQYGDCHDQVMQYVCICAAGYTGTTCGYEILECYSAPCNHGECNDMLNGFTCTCLPGYTGQYCDQDVNECLSNPCVNGNCVNNVNSFKCVCQPGYSGIKCEQEINECSSLPCLHGSCTDYINGYNCTCDNGYTGSSCDQNINECLSTPCVQGYCVDQVARYMCQCLTGYTGVNCDSDINECLSKPCVNGQCYNFVNLYTCSCTSGYTGPQCQINIDECVSRPCVHGACLDQINSYTCQCDNGYTGLTCYSDIDECLSMPCLNGVCNDRIAQFVCICPPGYVGVTCQINFNECSSNPCTQVCVDGINSYTCTCNPGFTGPNCDQEVNACLSSPCPMGATCYNVYGLYTCVCGDGSNGINCESNTIPMPCVSAPCRNGGTCASIANIYRCFCPVYITGQFCEFGIM